MPVCFGGPPRRRARYRGARLRFRRDRRLGTVAITQDAVDAVLANPDREIRFLAEQDGQCVGLACLVIANNELRACYIVPQAARSGIGSALLEKIEETARKAGLAYLQADPSLTAEAFYRRHGYEVVEHGQHMLRGGLLLACIKMRKTL